MATKYFLSNGQPLNILTTETINDITTITFLKENKKYIPTGRKPTGRPVGSQTKYIHKDIHEVEFTKNRRSKNIHKDFEPTDQQIENYIIEDTKKVY